MRDLTDGCGVDCVVEIGGPGTIAMSLKALAVGGHVSLIGASLSQSGTGLDPLLLSGRGIMLGSVIAGGIPGACAREESLSSTLTRTAADSIGLRC